MRVDTSMITRDYYVYVEKVTIKKSQIIKKCTYFSDARNGKYFSVDGLFEKYAMDDSSSENKYLLLRSLNHRDKENKTKSREDWTFFDPLMEFSHNSTLSVNQLVQYNEVSTKDCKLCNQ